MTINAKLVKKLSEREGEIISCLEFDKKHFFKSSDINHFFKRKSQRYNFIKKLLKKRRIVKLNQNKYYLIPMKAKSGWSEHPYIVIDEILNGHNYFINGWREANYWRLTEQIAMTEEVYTTKKRGEMKVLNIPIKFYHTTEKKIKEKSTIRTIQNHQFRIIKKEESRRWLRKRR